MKLGDKVTWTSQSAGIVRTKIGIVVDVVPPHATPPKIKNPGMPREHESYVIRASAQRKGRKANPSKLYWPKVNKLELYKEAA